MFRSLRKSSKQKEEKESEQIIQQPVVRSISDRSLLSQRGYVLSDQTLGEGSYSKVKRAYSKYQNCDIAVKIINRQIAPQDFLERFLPRELEIIGHLNHENICKFFEVCDTGQRVYLFMQYAYEGDLLEYIQRNRFVKESMAKEMFRQVCYHRCFT